LKRGFIASKLHPGKKSLEDIIIDRKEEQIQGKKFVWIDLQNPDRGVVEKLAREYNLNALNVEDCMTKFELPKIDSYDDHIFFILHFPPLTSKQVMSKFSQLSVFMGTDFLITIHQGDLKSLIELKESCKEDIDPERKNRILGSTTGVLLHEIIDVLVDDLLHTLRRTIANLDEIEEEVFDDRNSVARKISLLRREITMLRRIVNPLKRILLETAKQVQRFSKIQEQDLTLYFDDVIDHVDKAIDTLEESKETMEIYKDTDFMLSSEKTNKVLGVLTIIFTLAIPATVIGTFYGMNVNIPGGIEDSNSFSTFIIIIFASRLPAGLMFLYFRKLGWLSG